MGVAQGGMGLRVTPQPGDVSLAEVAPQCRKGSAAACGAGDVVGCGTRPISYRDFT